MKVVILAGGLGTRLMEETEARPKPMVEIGGRPILVHIMEHFAKYGHKDFYIALGYKAHIVKEYFLNYKYVGTDFTVNLSNGNMKIHGENKVDWTVTLVDTGNESMTGGRLKRMQPFIRDEAFMVTYGDGLSNVNIDDLINFHRAHGRMATVTSVRPPARFGLLQLDGARVSAFEEKNQLAEGWINGGYFVFNPNFLNLIEDDSIILEKGPLETAARDGKLMAWKHEGFWQCMDTKRDKDSLNDAWINGDAPWKK